MFTNFFVMKLLWISVLIGNCLTDDSLHQTGHSNINQIPAAPGPYVSSPTETDPYYADYYQQNPPESTGYPLLSERQTVETAAVLGAPVVITAFAAALFGGILSPLVSNGLAKMSEYEIQWPEFKKKEDGARDLNDFSWIETIEAVGQVLEDVNVINKRSTEELKTTGLGKLFSELVKEALKTTSSDTPRRK